MASLLKLEVFVMVGCSLVDDVGLRFLEKGCSLLKAIDVSRSDCVSSSGLISVISGHGGLEQLGAGYCLSINISYCIVSDMVLCMLMGNLKRLQDAKLVCLSKVSVKGLEVALRACCGRIKKVKLQTSLRFSLSSEMLETMHARGCKIRWD